MEVKNLLINQIIEKLRQASENEQGITLSHDEVVELYSEFKELVYIPVLSMEELNQLTEKNKNCEPDTVLTTDRVEKK